MISRAAEWYRIVNPQPTSATIDQRSSAVQQIIAAFDAAEDFDLVISAIAGVIGGFESGFAQDAPVIQMVVAAIKKHDSAFPQDLTDNALELRAAAATAIGEIISRVPEKHPDSSALLLASLVASGLGIRPLPPERYISEMITELHSAAKKVLDRAQQLKRVRPTSIGQSILSIPDNPPDTSDADPADAIKAFTTALKSTIGEFSHQLALDREELEVLWWLFTGASSTSGKQYSDISSGSAAFLAGVEVANLCILPPSANASAFVLRAMENVKQESSKRPLDKIVADSETATRGPLIANSDAKSLGEDYPVLFPLTWICARIVDSANATGWETEFITKSKLPATQQFDAPTLAIQVFRERIAQRQYASTIAG